MKKKFLIVISVVLLLLVVLNPSQGDFKSYAELNSDGQKVDCSRTSYFGVLSVYEFKGYDVNKRFIGFAKNFFQIQTEQENIQKIVDRMRKEEAENKNSIGDFIAAKEEYTKSNELIGLVTQKITKEELAARLKQKYPDYAEMNDDSLATKFLKKYPEFIPFVSL